MEQSLCVNIESDPSFTSPFLLSTFFESFVNPSGIYKRAGTAGIGKAEDYLSSV